MKNHSMNLFWFHNSSQYFHTGVCVCVCVCARARTRVLSLFSLFEVKRNYLHPLTFLRTLLPIELCVCVRVCIYI